VLRAWMGWDGGEEEEAEAEEEEAKVKMGQEEVRSKKGPEPKAK
jgi:hypothetical protein